MYYRFKKSELTLTHLILVLICAASMNVINRFYFFIFFAVGFFLLNPKRKLRLDYGPVMMLVVLAVSWILFSPDSTTSIFAPLKPFTYVLCYVIGASLIDDDKDFAPQKTPYTLFYHTVFAVGFGSLAHYALNWLTNMDAMDRNTVDFWSKSALAATGQAAFACIPLALAVACLFAKNNRRIKTASIATLLVVFGYNLILSGRTLFILALIVAVVAFLHKLSEQKEGRTKLFLIVVLIIAILVLAYLLNIFGIKTFIENSPFYDRFFAENSSTDLDEDGRLEKKLYYLENMGKFLWGGSNMHKVRGYAHDILLDTYDEAGIFALLAIFIYMAITVKHLVKCLRDKTLSFAFRQTVLCIYVVLYFEFLVEPILQGAPFLFASFCLIDGYVNRIVVHNKTLKTIEGEL